MKPLSNFLWALLPLLLCHSTVNAQADRGSYPSRPVTIINPFPGGAIDVGTRLYAQKLTESMGKPFLIDYKPGAAATIAAGFVARAPADGYTLLATSATFSISAATHKDLPYDPLRDFAPISLMLKKPAMLMVHPSLPIHDYSEYIAYARANPGALNFGTTGMGGSYHMVGAWLHGATNTQVTFAHYKGTAQLFVDNVAGRIHVSPASIFNGLPYTKSGKLRPIMIISAERSALLPGMKTVAEQGIADFDYPAWEGMLTGAAVPRAIVNRLSAEFARLARSPDIIDRFSKDGSIMVGNTPDEFRDYLKTEITRWRRIVIDNDIKAGED